MTLHMWSLRKPHKIISYWQYDNGRVEYPPECYGENGKLIINERAFVSGCKTYAIAEEEVRLFKEYVARGGSFEEFIAKFQEREASYV